MWKSPPYNATIPFPPLASPTWALYERFSCAPFGHRASSNDLQVALTLTCMLTYTCGAL